MLSIILTTSPTVSNPSTELIENIIESFGLVSSLLTCKLIIVCDGVKELSDDQFEI